MHHRPHDESLILVRVTRPLCKTKAVVRLNMVEQPLYIRTLVEIMDPYVMGAKTQLWCTSAVRPGRLIRPSWVGVMVTPSGRWDDINLRAEQMMDIGHATMTYVTMDPDSKKSE